MTDDLLDPDVLTVSPVSRCEFTTASRLPNLTAVSGKANSGSVISVSGRVEVGGGDPGDRVGDGPVEPPVLMSRQVPVHCWRAVLIVAAPGKTEPPKPARCAHRAPASLVGCATPSTMNA